MHDAIDTTTGYPAFLGRLVVGYAVTGVTGGALVMAVTAAWTQHWGGLALSLAVAAGCVSALRRSAPWRPYRAMRDGRKA